MVTTTWTSHIFSHGTISFSCLAPGKLPDWDMPMLAKTHGQPASPTNLAKEFKVRLGENRWQKTRWWQLKYFWNFHPENWGTTDFCPGWCGFTYKAHPKWCKSKIIDLVYFRRFFPGWWVYVYFCLNELIFKMHSLAWQNAVIFSPGGKILSEWLWR